MGCIKSTEYEEMPLIYSPYYRMYKRQQEEREQLERGESKDESPINTVKVRPKSPDNSSEEEDEPKVHQTFPKATSSTVVRQMNDDLTCGMRSLQNMYGKHIVTREEMDEQAEQLEQRAFGVKMYDKKLGYYHVEVIKAVLLGKGKYVQRIDQDKITSRYFHPVIALNTLFSGYIVALQTDTVKHYVAIRSAQGQLRMIDSLPGTSPVLISSEELFQRRSDNLMYCCDSDTRPVVAILAVGGSPFLEYQLMHDTWSETQSTPLEYKKSIESVLHTPALSLCTWQKKWNKSRTSPDQNTYDNLKARVLEHTSGEIALIIKMEDKQTIIKCQTIEELVTKLTEMEWIREGQDCIFKQNGRPVKNKQGKTDLLDANGPIHSLQFKKDIPLTLVCEEYYPHQAQVGGFYQFDYSVSGKCIGAQRNAYSVRDTDGTVHVVYKGNIERIEKIKR